MPAETLDILVRMKDFASAELKRLEGQVGATAGAGARGFGLWEGAIGKAKSMLLSFGGTMLAYFSARAIGSAIARTVNWADNLEELSQQLGVTTEALSELEYVASLNGATIEDLETGFRIAQKTLADLALTGGGPAAKAMELLAGDTQMAVREGMRLEDLLPKIARDIRGLGEADRVLVASQLFGRGGAKLLPTLITDLEEGRKKARELGVTLSSEMAARAGEAADEFAELKAGVNSLFRDMGIGLAHWAATTSKAMKSVADVRQQIMSDWSRSGGWGPPGPKSTNKMIEDLQQEAAKVEAVSQDVWQGTPSYQQYKIMEEQAAKAVRLEEQLAGIRAQRNLEEVQARQDQHAASLQAQADQENELRLYREQFDAMAGLIEQMRRLGVEARSFGYQAAGALLDVRDAISNNVTDALTSLVMKTQSAKEAFRDMLAGMAQDLASSSIRRTMDMLLGSLLGAIGGGLSGGLGGLFSGGGSIGSGEMSSLIQSSMPGRAMGGPVYRDGPHYLHKDEQVLTPDQGRAFRSGGMGPAVTNNISVHVGASDVGGSQSDIRRRGRELADVIAEQLGQHYALRSSVREAVR